MQSQQILGVEVCNQRLNRKKWDQKDPPTIVLQSKSHDENQDFYLDRRQHELILRSSALKLDTLVDNKLGQTRPYKNLQ